MTDQAVAPRIPDTQYSPFTARKAAKWMVVGLLLLAGAVCVGFVASSGNASPKMKVSTTSLDLADGQPSEEVKGEIQLENVGGKDLEFTVSNSCGCTNVSPREGVIPPGGALSVSVSVKLPGHANAEKSVSVVFHSNDPQRPDLRCAVFARAPAPLIVEPSIVDFGSVSSGEKPEVILRVSRRDNQELLPQHLLIEKDSTHLRLLSEPGNNGAVTLQIALKETVPDAFYDSLELNLVGNKYPIIVPVKYNRVKPFLITPSTALLRRDPELGSWKDLILIATSQVNELRLGDLHIVDIPEGLEVTEEASIAGGRLKQLRLTVKDSSAWEANGLQSTLSLSFGGVSGKFTVNLRRSSN